MPAPAIGIQAIARVGRKLLSAKTGIAKTHMGTAAYAHCERSRKSIPKCESYAGTQFESGAEWIIAERTSRVAA